MTRDDEVAASVEVLAAADEGGGDISRPATLLRIENL